LLRGTALYSSAGVRWKTESLLLEIPSLNNLLYGRGKALSKLFWCMSEKESQLS
jgi:hypothetical protein